MMPTFNYYSGTSDPLLHLGKSPDRMAVYSHDDLPFYRAISSSLKGATYHWFYSLPKNSLQSFENVTDVFYN